MSGTDLVADGLTKALQGQAFLKCRQGLHLGVEEAVEPQKEAVCEKAGGSLLHLKKLAVIGGALMKRHPVAGCAVLVGLYVLLRRVQQSTEEAKLATEVAEGTPCIRMFRAQDHEAKSQQLRSNGAAGVNYESGSGRVDDGGQPWAQHGPLRGEVKTSKERWEIAKEIVAQGYQAPVPPSGSGEPARQVLADGSVEIVEVQKEEKIPVDWCAEPWNLKEFSEPKVKDKDLWSLQLWDRGWLLRVHSTGRQKRFHPVHETIPCNPDQLDGTRVTVAWLTSGEKYILEDSWLERHANRHLSDWKGLHVLEENTNEGIRLRMGSTRRARK